MIKSVNNNNKNIEIKDINKTRSNISNTNTDKLIDITGGSISTTTIIGSDIWIGKLGGELLRYNLYTNDSTKYLDNNYTIKDFSIKKILDMGNRIIALQSDRVIEIYKSNDFIDITKFPLDIARATDIVVFKNSVYISTLGYGIWEYNLVTNGFRQILSDLKYISSLLITEDKLYIGTMNDGLYCYNLNNKTIDSRLSYPLALFNKNILHMNINKSIIWLGTSINGLIKWDLNTNSTKRIYRDESVSSIFLNNEINAVSFIGLGIYIEVNNETKFESIDTILKTNNVTSVKIFNDKLISGNIKKGLIKQEMSY